MKPPPFEYRTVDTVEEAVSLLAEHGWEAKLLAGGQSLVPAMNFRLAQPAMLVDVNPITSLELLERTGDGGLRIGALCRQARLEREPAVAEAAPLLAEAVPHVAHPQIRNRGTVGGSLAHADPAAELPAVMLALGARLQATGRDGTRWIDAEEFFYGLMTTALAPDEMLTEIVVPPAGAGRMFAFEEVARRHGDYALAGVAVSIGRDDDGACRDARLALFAVGEAPQLSIQGAAALEGRAPDEGVIAEAAEAAAAEVDPPSDLHASSEFRRHLVRVLVRRAVARALRVPA